LYDRPMGDITIQEARLIAREAGLQADTPRFYRENESSVLLSETIYNTDETVRRYRDYLARQADDFGHGLSHSELVALDAGAIIAAEIGDTAAETTDTIVVAQTAGLLHDIRRKEPNHAEKSAEEADRILERYGAKGDHRAVIVAAIRNHEAFKEEIPITDRTGGLVSNALYDADKFRWGPDNFVVTLWDMLEFARIDVRRMLAGYHKSLEGIKRIRETFRTQTGRRYGPEFIDIGLAVGDVIYCRLIERQENRS
jgi:hypothetical protein